MRQSLGVNTRLVLRLLISTAMTATVVINAPARAQDTPAGQAAAPAANPSVEQDIVVTASKRSESLSKTPLAISALSQTQLDKAGVVAIADLATTVPSLQISQAGIGDAVVTTIRGIQSAILFQDGDPAVAVYIDGVNVPRTQGLNDSLYDIERVEVLRGPQGTLYGRNATAGSINILTASPKLGRTEASASASYGNYDDIQLGGMLNLPVSKTLAVRGAFSFHKNTGYFDNLGTVRDYGRADTISGRLTALWKPADVFKWRLSVSDTVSKGTPIPGISTDANGQPSDGLPVYRRPMSADITPYRRVTNFAVRSRMDLDLSSHLSLSYVAGYGRTTYDTDQITGGQPLPFVPGKSLAIAEYGRSTNQTMSHELDLTYDIGRLHTIFGTNYFFEKNRNIANFPVYHLLVDFDFTVPDTTSRSIGVFSQSTYKVTDTLRLTGGVRYTWDRKAKNGEFISYCPFRGSDNGNYEPNPACYAIIGDDGRGRWSKFNWKIAADFDLSPSVLLYASVSTGYKAGGNGDANAPGLLPPSYQPENITNYEAGLKYRSADRRLTASATVFYMQYKDIQVYQTQQPIGQLITNAGAAHDYGIELEASWRPNEADRLSFYATPLSAKYTRYDNATDQLNQTIYRSLAGNYLPLAPVFSGRASYEHDFALPGGGKITPSVGVYYQSRTFLREFNLAADRVPGFSKTDLDLRYANAADTLTLSLYVQNVEDNIVRTAAFPLAGVYLSYYAPPRTYGAKLQYKF